ncbi:MULTISPECIES: DoxX family protein [unclassified Haloferax]|jgi:thiosulfate dehydrogenase [quinone] large subunit|uniref:DoxX family protein n=1 Tax=unclassified Haloferax TaxID=2625095 RepID=UPI002875D734|nr:MULTISPECIES: DoxX family protein [unclassified Haloferax]MDS0243222.1 DoxX family protein [Haloferax sp. S2CR25]MDS0446343.1 DoxX family protein [Haloferax sp. S2CR25-2]
MATTTPQSGVNELESRIGRFTVRGRAHSLSAWFVLALRLMMGYAFAYSGFTKLTGPEPFAAGGYLTNVAAANGNPLAGMFAWMGSTPWFVEFANLAVPWGELFIGLGLLVGALTRLAAFFGALMMLMFYFGNWSVEHGLVNGDFAYMLVFLAVAAFGAGRILGLDAYLEQYEIGGKALVERYPALEYVLG